jgi:hypothetical protein
MTQGASGSDWGLDSYMPFNGPLKQVQVGHMLANPYLKPCTQTFEQMPYITGLAEVADIGSL